jgi:ribosomal protein S27E
MELLELECEGCHKLFAVQKDYEGTITCPYCGQLIEY